MVLQTPPPINKQSLIGNVLNDVSTTLNISFDLGGVSSASTTSELPPSNILFSNTCDTTLRENNVAMPLNQVKDVLARTELLCQAQLLEKDKEIHSKEKHIQTLDKEICRHKKEKSSANQAQTQMMKCVEEYEKTISEIISERQRDKICAEIEREKLQKEKSQVIEDLQSAERAFNDVHRKYERMKEVISDFKKNEDELKSVVKDYSTRMHRAEEKYTLLKNHAESKINEANERLETVQKSRQVEIAKLSAMLRKAEMKVTSLERTLEQKNREHTELTTICDDLINRVGK